MSSLFSRPRIPDPPAPPTSPTKNEEQESERIEVERAAVAESKAAGRRSTIVAGMKIAADEQYDKGLLGSRRRAAARDLGG